MDRIRVSEALDTGSIPVGRAKVPLISPVDGGSTPLRRFERFMKTFHILLECHRLIGLERLLRSD